MLCGKPVEVELYLRIVKENEKRKRLFAFNLYRETSQSRTRLGSLDQQVSLLIQPETPAGRHNRGSAIFGDDSGAGRFFPDLHGVAVVDCSV